jgi:hypothetical protein
MNERTLNQPITRADVLFALCVLYVLLLYPPPHTLHPAGARILEANLSCPNVGSLQGVLYSDPAAVADVTGRLRSAFPHLPLILKVIVDKLIFIYGYHTSALRWTNALPRPLHDVSKLLLCSPSLVAWQMWASVDRSS